MLTRQGWVVLALAGVLIAFGRILGVLELFVAGSAIGALVLAAALLVDAYKVQLGVRRRIQPSRVHAGHTSRVEMTITNQRHRRTPQLVVSDPVVGTRGVTTSIPPVPANGRVQLGYLLPTDKRGVVRVGPLDFAILDPFGLARVNIRGAGTAELIVYPRLDDLLPTPGTLGHDPHGGAENPNVLGRVGEDFYALRPYTVGDDLRRVHWGATAKRDEIMVRQDELPWQGRTTVLLDQRRETYQDPEAFELAVSATASIVVSSFGRRDLVRVVTTDAGDSGFGTGNAHGDAILEFLAKASPTARGGLGPTLAMLRRGSNAGALVVVTASPSISELTALESMRSSFGAVTVVAFEPPSWGAPSRAEAHAIGSRPGLISVGAEATFAEAWNSSVRRRHVRALGAAL